MAASQAGVFWLEFDPDSGHNLLRKVDVEGSQWATSPSFDIRSQVNGYGGGALCAGRDAVYAVEASQQQIHRIDPVTGVTNAVTQDRGASFGGLVWDPFHHRTLAVCERSGRQQLVAVRDHNEIVHLHDSEVLYRAPTLAASC